MNNSYNKTGKGHNSSNLQDLGLHFLSSARLASSRGPCDMDEDEASPTALNPINSSGGFLLVAVDKLSIKYTGGNLHGHDVGVIQSNYPAPVKRIVYYFEIYVENAGAKGQIAIGFTTESFNMRRQPGWEANSCGYHGVDGLLYHGHDIGEAFGPTYSSGDIVGGGINYATEEFFFTKNGAVVGTVPKDIKDPLFPTVAVHSQNEEKKKLPLLRLLICDVFTLPGLICISLKHGRVHVNFGQKPFTFDWKEFESQERMKQQSVIEKISLPSNVSYRIVRSYLLHYGYEDTLNAFDMASKNTVPPIYVTQENDFDEQEIIYALNERKTLRQLIRNGEIDSAIARIREWYPQILQDDKSATCFALHCQKFIELVRVGSLEDAVKFGRVELAKFFDLPNFENLVQDCVALLAYEQPHESSVGFLLEDSQRELVADIVNAMILSTNPNMKDAQSCLHSHLERFLRQLTTSCLEKRSLNGEQGEAFNLCRVLDSGKKAKC